MVDGYLVLEAAHDLMEIYKDRGNFLAFRLLRSIAAHPDWHAQKHVPPCVSMNTGNFTIRALIRDGLVARSTQGRNVFCELTPAGHAALANAIDQIPRVVASDQFVALLQRCSSALPARKTVTKKVTAKLETAEAER